MVFRVVQRGEVCPVVFDFRTIGHIKTYRAEDFLDTLPRADHGMDAANAAAPPRQRDIDGFSGKTRIELSLGHFSPARVEQRLDRLLDLIDSRAFDALLLGIELCEPFEQFGQRPLLAEESRLGVLKRRRISGSGELRPGLFNQVIGHVGHEGEASTKSLRENANGARRPRLHALATW